MYEILIRINSRELVSVRYPYFMGKYRELFVFCDGWVTAISNNHDVRLVCHLYEIEFYYVDPIDDKVIIITCGSPSVVAFELSKPFAVMIKLWNKLTGSRIKRIYNLYHSIHLKNTLIGLSLTKYMTKIDADIYTLIKLLPGVDEIIAYKSFYESLRSIDKCDCCC